MESIVFSFVGEQDPYSDKTKEEGSIITLVRHLLRGGKQIKRVILLYTDGTKKGAIDTRDWIASEPELAGVGTEIIPVSEKLSDDPIDLLLAAQEVRKRLEDLLDSEAHIEFNASSGTPAMKSAFSILQAAGYVNNATVWQVRNPKQMRLGQDRVFVTDVGVLRREFELQILRSQVEIFNFDSASDLFGESDIADRFPQKDLISSYLEAGKAWQRSKLDDFKNHIDTQLNDDQKVYCEKWYYPAYEEAYLAIVKCKQGNIVEAFFHSFRAFEGILAFWGKQTFKDHIEENNGGVYLKPSVLEGHDRYFPKAKYKNGKGDNDIAKLKCEIARFFNEQADKEEEKRKNYLLSFSPLCKFFRSFTENYKNVPGLKDLLTDRISNERNIIVHQLQGLKEEDLYKVWGVKDCAEWESRILQYLNFIASQSFSSWNEASLLATTHQKILFALSEYQP